LPGKALLSKRGGSKIYKRLFEMPKREANNLVHNSNIIKIQCCALPPPNAPAHASSWQFLQTSMSTSAAKSCSHSPRCCNDKQSLENHGPSRAQERTHIVAPPFLERYREARSYRFRIAHPAVATDCSCYSAATHANSSTSGSAKRMHSFATVLTGMTKVTTLMWKNRHL